MLSPRVLIAVFGLCAAIALVELVTNGTISGPLVVGLILSGMGSVVSMVRERRR